MTAIRRLGAVLAFTASAAAAAPAPVEVMIVGDFHMANPGQDMANVKVDDVLAPARQAEIQAVTDALARFRPTVVATEWPAATVAERYPKYLDGSLPPSRNEVVQLGFRLARQAGARIIGADADGDFPYARVEAFARAHGQVPPLEAEQETLNAIVGAQEKVLREKGVAATLRHVNEPARIASDNGFYQRMLRFGDGDDQPGADLVSAWRQRNLRICAKLVQAARPGDRMVVFFGAGHAYLLRQCVTETPGLRLVEPNAWLPK